MDFKERFQDRLQCICKEHVIFEVIPDVECDWGTHFLIQCPSCEELFSVDCRCPAFGDVLELTQYNDLPYSDTEKSQYIKNSHPP